MVQGTTILLNEQRPRDVPPERQIVQEGSHRTQGLAGSPQDYLVAPDDTGPFSRY